MGYSTQLPEWIILDPRPGRLRNAYSVTFDEEKPGLPEITDNDENVVNTDSIENMVIRKIRLN